MQIYTADADAGLFILVSVSFRQSCLNFVKKKTQNEKVVFANVMKKAVK